MPVSVSSESAGLSVVDATERVVRETSRAVTDHCRLAKRPGCVTSSIGIMPDQSIVPPRNGEENPGLLRRRLISEILKEASCGSVGSASGLPSAHPLTAFSIYGLRLLTGSACLTQ